MIEVSPPSLLCLPLPRFDPTDWDEVSKAFAAAARCDMRQGWRKAPDPLFQPARVWVGWMPGQFWVYTELDDVDIFNQAEAHNDPTYQLGDVFEMFLRPLPDEPYIELHVTPDNHKLQLRFPSSILCPNGEISTKVKSSMLHEVVFESWTQVWPDKAQWRVLACIPDAALTIPQAIADGANWLFSFSRYDYTRGQSKPVLSSTSPHRTPNFHRQLEWGRLVFRESAAPAG